MEEVIEFLKSIDKRLANIENKSDLPRIIHVKELANEYKIAPETARQICKKYGTNVGGLGIESGKLLWVLQNEGLNILK